MRSSASLLVIVSAVSSDCLKSVAVSGLITALSGSTRMRSCNEAAVSCRLYLSPNSCAITA